MTALAMIIGMLPMALGLGEGGEQNAPLGRAVIGGLIVATFTTLFFVPIMYSLLRKNASDRSGSHHRRRSARRLTGTGVIQMQKSPGQPAEPSHTESHPGTNGEPPQLPPGPAIKLLAAPGKAGPSRRKILLLAGASCCC